MGVYCEVGGGFEALAEEILDGLTMDTFDPTCDEIIFMDTVRNLFKMYNGQNGYKGGDMYGQNFRETRTRRNAI